MTAAKQVVVVGRIVKRNGKVTLATVKAPGHWTESIGVPWGKVSR